MSFFIDPKDLPAGVNGFVQVLFLGVVYGFVLFKSSNLISDGSELLLLVPSLAGLVGSVVLPVLGAVPDGAIVLFSGMGPDAQNQLSVGVGALAGSTIMLLTLPWALSVIAGRVNLDRHGNGNYKRPRNAPDRWSKLMPEDNKDLKRTGVVVGPEISTIGKMMMATSLIYLIIQIPAFKNYGTKKKDANTDILQVAAGERSFAYVGFFLCLFAFISYLVWNVRRSSKINDDALEERRIQAIRNGDISLSGLMCEEFKRIHRRASNGTAYGTVIDESREDYERLEAILRPFFKKYDQDKDNRMDAAEMRLFFKDLNEDITSEEIEHWFREADSDKSGFIEFRELVEATIRFLREKNHHPTSPFGKAILYGSITSFGDGDSEEEGDEEEDDIPDDLSGLSVEEQQRKIKLRSLWMMSLGTALVLIFSDPMVDVLSEIGNRTGIPAFYISFIVAPLASNASELIASYNYAKKKTSKTISVRQMNFC